MCEQKLVKLNANVKFNGPNYIGENVSSTSDRKLLAIYTTKYRVSYPLWSLQHLQQYLPWQRCRQYY